MRRQVLPKSSPELQTGNRLLDAALSSGRLDALREQFETVSLRHAQSIHEPGERARFVLFPTSGMISIMAAMADGSAVESGIVGKEGMFSVSVLLGDDTPAQKAIVQLAGSAVRVNAAQLREVADADTGLRKMLLRYAQAMLMTATQSAACNRLHSLEQRCARWLLSAHDRAERDTFPITHEFLAIMLGVRRPGVTLAVQSFRDDGMITYNHGSLTILDRAGLERASCECYRFVQTEFSRLLAELSS
jgi:CRP-like cAMP-binding protein